MTPQPTAWAHLPNANHIDRIIADLKALPDVRNAAWDTAWDTARDAARDAAWDAAWDAARDAAWNAARDAAAWDSAAWSAARVLVAWDDVAYILALPPDAVRMLLKTCTDHHKHAAILLLPACIVLNKGEQA